MNSRSKTERAGPGRRFDDLVSDLIVRTGRDVSRLGFSLVDAPAREPPKDEGNALAAASLEQARLKVEAARAAAWAEARRMFEVELETKLAEERGRTERVRQEFARDRQRFFAAAESQVVLLALAIARRVLAHEVAADGMHLRATVKAALARVQDGSATILRVPEDEAQAWTAMFESGTSGKVQVMADERMAPGECSLQTNVGTVDLGVDVQMEEIARGFSELMHNQGEAVDDRS